MLVSVIMPTYNCGKFILESIDSVIAQTISDWEIQIVDDCSTDETQKIIQPYLDKYATIHYYRFSQNRGPAAARSEAIQRACGKYIAFLDSDDLWYPDKLEKQIAFMDRTNTLFSATAYEQMTEDGQKKGISLFPPKKCDYKKMLRLSNPIGNTTVMYNQEVLGKFVVPDIKKRNDFALWLKIMHTGCCCAGLQEVLATYRVRSNSVSSNKLGQAKYHWQLYHKIEKLNVFLSFWYIICWAIVKGTGWGIKRGNTIA